MRLDVTGRPIELREVDLDRFFRPRSVAVIGASDTDGSQSALNYRLVRGWLGGRDVAVFPVNPNRDEVDGERCYRSVGDIPGDVDVAIVLVQAVREAIEACIEKKVAFAVVFASGFAEAGEEGRARQAEVEELVRTSDLRLLGPNTALNAFQPVRELPAPKIALVTQSGQQGRPLYQAQDLGIALHAWAPTGNEADLESADFIRHFAGRDDVGAIACYIEGFKDGRTLQLAADHAAKRGVPVVAVKVGRTDVGRSWAKSHTGHLAGSDAVISAAFRQYGITRVDGLDELQDVSMMLARCGPPVADGVCIYAISGGAGAHVADLARAAGLRLPELSAKTQKRLREWIPSYLRVSNPVDCGGIPVGDERGPKILDTLLKDPAVGVLLVPIAGFFPGLADRLASDLAALRPGGSGGEPPFHGRAKIHYHSGGPPEQIGKPVCVVWGSPTADEPAYRDVLLQSTLPVFRSVRNCLTAIKAWVDYNEFRARYRPFKPVMRRSLDTALRRGTLGEHESKLLLASYGITVTREEVCASAAEAVRAAESIGYPVVVKGTGVAHKSERGLVRLSLRSPREVREAYAAVGGEVLVSEMLTGGVECIAGVTQDELFGPVVMFGLGGIAVEVFGDVTFRVPPFDKAEARRMIEEIRAFPLLRGARGGPKANLGAIADVLMKVQRLALDLSGSLTELDVNPLLARPDGAVALDALAVSR